MVRPPDEPSRVDGDSFSDLDSIETPARELVEALARPSSLAELGVPPARIGRYSVTGRLGSGGMGVVYAGHDAELDRRVAIKLVRGAWLRGAEAAARLRREAQALARLSHPNVIVVYEVGEHVDPTDPIGGQVFIGRVYYGMEQLDEALATFERVLATRERTLPAGHTDVADALHMIGRIESRQGRHDRALEHLRRALQIYEAALPPGDAQIAVASYAVADALLQRGDAAEALPLAERALAIRERPDQRPLDRADAQTLVAKVLVASGGDRTRAFALADAAGAAYRERPDAAAVLAELERWRSTAR